MDKISKIASSGTFEDFVEGGLGSIFARGIHRFVENSTEGLES